MVKEARLEATESGLKPTTEGWFVVNVRDARWFDHDVFGASCEFESLDAEFTELGIRICVVFPGQPGLRQRRRHRRRPTPHTHQERAERPAFWDRLPWS